MTSRCPACDGFDVERFHAQSEVPVNSCLLLDSEEEALCFPRGTIDLHVCTACGFVFNAAFEPALIEYSSRYEETQAFSPRFRAFAGDLADRWIERYDLRDRRVLEIGCGKGDFLVELCRRGVASATGVDPAVAPERMEDPAARRIRWVADRYDERYRDLEADAIVCRHTLEHIPDVADFLTIVRRAVGDRTDTVVLFEVPDVLRVLREVAFWDVYYEHCSYFSPGSLARLFRRSGFEVLALWLGFDEQYIVIEAVPAVRRAADTLAHPLEEDPGAIVTAAAAFGSGYERKLATTRDAIDRVTRDGGRVAIWGAGSKGVAYLTNLSASPSAVRAVDINPFKHDRFLAGSGVRVVAPTALQRSEPDLVVAMNPIYESEIERELRTMGLDARLVSV